MIQRIGSIAARGTDPLAEGAGISSKQMQIGRSIRKAIIKTILKTDLFFLIAGFLLGRAVILSSLTPFILPFFATVFWLNRKKRWQASMMAIFGALTVSVGLAFYSLMALMVFLFVRHIARLISKKNEVRWLPVMVFISALSVRLLYQAAFTLNLVWTDLMTAAVEASLAILVTLIFIQSVPLLSSRMGRRLYKNEEIICFVILLSSILAGTTGWAIMDVSIEHVLARYVVLLFALAGGAAIGSTVGVIMGLVLGMSSSSSLYQMSLLAFSGVLGGLLKETGKAGVAAGLFIATLLIGLYGGGYSGLVPEMLDSLIAVSLFMLTPKGLMDRLASLIPGTREYQKEQQQYVRKLRDVTVSRVEQFSSLFQTLARSFHAPDPDTEHEDDLFLSKVTANTCQNCYKKEYCWVKNFDQTHKMMLQLREETRSDRKGVHSSAERKWRAYCSIPDQTLGAIAREQRVSEIQELMRHKVKESQRLVADQLHGVSRVMGDFASEMKRERGLHDRQEEIILARLHAVGLRAESVEIYNLESGSIDIEVVLQHDDYGACEKVIAPLLSDILGENIVVSKKQEGEITGAPFSAVFTSARAFEIETGVATAARGGGLVSGDNYALFEAGAGKYALAISDGMGSGERAGVESKDTLQLLAKVLKSGIHETLAIKSINSILSLRSTEEIYATLDLALIDLQNAKSKFLKIGSNPSFIKRGNKIWIQDSGNLPIGMIEDFDVDVKTEQLKSGDLLIMMSDGIFDAPKHIENKELWLKRKIRELQTDHPQEVADLILEEVIRLTGGRIDDDMTVIVARIRHYLPKWSSIPAGGNKQRLSRAE
ncbi:stage II sporulation protein E [Sporolactobacillus sp. Y61]|jgi:stage II sporulation protein E|uniref:Stage II sporulation protein E n=1 Tax=Sporolactobacillus sp. Y61 TaxID=3160863 RepID=A0AAU8IH77_9BACL|nr:stage II sporulation protein E [Sporolactobacillus sp. THM19-2]